MKIAIKVDKNITIPFHDAEGGSLQDLMSYLTHKHEELEKNLKDGEYIVFEEAYLVDSQYYKFQVYRKETDEEYQLRLDKKAEQERKDRERDMQVLQRLAKKYPDVKIEL